MKKIERRTIIIAVISAVFLLVIWGFLIEKPRREKAYEASITEIEAEILDFYQDKKREPYTVRLRTGSELSTIKFKNMVSPGYRFGDVPEIDKKIKKSILDGKEKDLFFVREDEIGEESIYRVKYAGLGEVKKVLEMELIQSKEDVVRRLVLINEMPDISEWDLFSDTIMERESLSTGKLIKFRRKILYRFEVLEHPRSNIECSAYYDISKEEPVLGAMVLEYDIMSGWYTGEKIAIKIWIKNGGLEFYNLSGDDFYWICPSIRERDYGIGFKVDFF